MVSSSSCKSVEWKKKWWCTCQTSNILPTKKNLNFWDIFIDGVLNLLTYTIPKIIYYESLQKGFKSWLFLLIKTKTIWNFSASSPPRSGRTSLPATTRTRRASRSWTPSAKSSRTWGGSLGKSGTSPMPSISSKRR